MTPEDREYIKFTLSKNSLSQVWLINRLEERGITTDKAELSSALSGARHGTKINNILKVSMEILNEYESKTQVKTDDLTEWIKSKIESVITELKNKYN
ncbi:MAG: hypothetical protein SPL13_02665 [Clostridia bacterium]|nr:hypothetical protein [Clostridia bacterium]